MFFLLSEKHASWKMIIMPSFFRRVCKAAKLFLCCSQHTMEYLPQLDPQLNNSKPDVSLFISKDSVERLELLSLSSQYIQCLSIGRVE